MACHKAVTFLLPVCLVALAGCGPKADPCDGPCPATKIDHLVVVVQENHTFDSYFSQYCTAPTGSNPTCTAGAACCETGPATDPGSGSLPLALTDAANGNYDRDHQQICEEDEIDHGAMDRFVDSTIQSCGDARNFAYASGSEVQPYWTLARGNALADRYFQPIAGQSDSNDVYLAEAKYVFTDNAKSPNSDGSTCGVEGAPTDLTDPNIGDLLVKGGVSWSWYAEGYSETVQAVTQKPPTCPKAPSDCPGAAFGLDFYPCTYSPGDVPLEFYPQYKDNPKYMKDFTQLASDLKSGKLPQVVFIKPYGFRSEHPGFGDTISAGAAFVTGVVQTVQRSSYADRTLVLVTWDEGGGFFDHIAPPATSTVDNQPYGTRVPLLAIGPFAKKDAVSHVTMEHSSILKFIEWNWLGKTTGQLGNRDAQVNNIGSMLDASKTGIAVPEQ